MKKLLLAFIFSHLFLSSIVLFRTPFEFYIGYVSYFFLPFLFFKYGPPKYALAIFLVLFVIGIIFVQLGLNNYSQLIKVTTGFFLSVAFFEFIFKFFDGDIYVVFKFYLKSAFVLSVIGLVQVVTFRLGFSPGYNFGWILNKWGVVRSDGGGIRMNALFSEPSYFASTIAPAFFVALYNLINWKNVKFISVRQSLVIVLAYPLTQSGVGMFGILISILLLLINSGILKYGFFIFPIILFAFNSAYEANFEFRSRVDSTFEIYDTGNIYSYDIHGSSFVLYNHTHIAKENFKENPIFGTGLGSHETAFDRFSLTNLQGVVEIEFNKADANSMALRIMSETGIVGLLFFSYFLVSNLILKISAFKDDYWVISNACFLIIALQLLRQGNYFYCGFPFFLWLYYYTKNANARDKRGVVKDKFKFQINAK
jgi:hypothetical protein